MENTEENKVPAAPEAGTESDLKAGAEASADTATDTPAPEGDGTAPAEAGNVEPSTEAPAE